MSVYCALPGTGLSAFPHYLMEYSQQSYEIGTVSLLTLQI